MSEVLLIYWDEVLLSHTVTLCGGAADIRDDVVPQTSPSGVVLSAPIYFVTIISGRRPLINLAQFG